MSIVLSMIRTPKSDWFTNYLYQKGLWVGGTFLKNLNHPNIRAKQTVRFFKSNLESFIVVYILDFDDVQDPNLDYEKFIKECTESFGLVPDFTLAIWSNTPISFAVLKNGKFEFQLSTNDVLDHFSRLDKSIVGSSSYLKPINKSYTDYFHLWARNHLRGFQNDIDSFLIDRNGVHMIELKRPIESVSTWRPYTDDTINYLQFRQFCEINDFELTNIAYSVNELGKIKIFKNVEQNGNKGLSYLSANVNIKPEDDLFELISNSLYKNEDSTR